MPAYNAEKYIGDAIESVLDQTFTDFEFIIIDDFSTDRTWRIIQEYARKDKRITVLRNDRNLGVSLTRNKLIMLSEGKYIVWQDSDDISMPYRIAHQYDFMEKHPEVGICGGYLQFFGAKGLGRVRKYAPDDASLRKTIFRYSPVAQPAAILRQACLEKTGFFPALSPVAEDLALAFQIGTRYKFANLQEIVIKYRENEQGITFTKLRIMELFTLFLRAQYEGHKAYKMRSSDKIYNTVQSALVYAIPPRLKIKIFNLLRNG